jgi:hypothetical protein
MLSQTLDSLKSQIDTVYLHTDNTRVLEQLIQSQNIIYGIIITVLLVILALNFWSNHKKIKTDLEIEIQNSLSGKLESIKTEVIEKSEKNINEKFATEKKRLENKIDFVSGQSFRMIGVNLGINKNDIVAIQWFFASLSFLLKAKEDRLIRLVLDSILTALKRSLINESKKRVFDSLIEVQDFKSLRKYLEACPESLDLETKEINLILDQIEKGKDDDTKPNQVVKE